MQRFNEDRKLEIDSENNALFDLPVFIITRGRFVREIRLIFDGTLYDNEVLFCRKLPRIPLYIASKLLLIEISVLILASWTYYHKTLSYKSYLSLLQILSTILEDT